ncbi:MAG: DNA repair exonuclease [Zestosphaera sp.]
MLVHTADLHVGSFSGKPLSDASVKAFEEISRHTLESGSRYLVISGDLFERPRFENYSVVNRVARTLRDLRDRGVKVVCVPGSHDTSVRGNDLIHLLREAGLIHLPTHEESREGLTLNPLELGDYVFYGIPGLRNGLEAKFLSEGRVVFRGLESVVKPVILLAHTGVKFYGYDPSDYSYRYGRMFLSGDGWLRELPNRVRYVALGHIHYPVPLLDEGRVKAAYPGAVVGRDRSDLYETYTLKREGRMRRFLEVDVGDDVPVVRSVWSDFGVDVVYERLVLGDVRDLTNHVRALAKDIRGAFKALLIDITNVKPDKLGQLMYEASKLDQELRGHGTTLMLKPELVSESGALSIDTSLSGDVLELIERSVVEEAAKKLSSTLTPERLLKLIELLSKRKPEGVNEDEFYESLYKETRGLLEEMFSE